MNAACTGNTDCRYPEEVCRMHRCQQCVSDECGDNMVCESGRCVSRAEAAKKWHLLVHVYDKKKRLLRVDLDYAIVLESALDSRCRHRCEGRTTDGVVVCPWPCSQPELEATVFLAGNPLCWRTFEVVLPDAKPSTPTASSPVPAYLAPLPVGHCEHEQ